ncbi:hypothetical protein TTHERM_01044640 (macronuclear) [Tetrahymena thermophila SB210]|uniref:ubiquitinyl hydrolase 1 n=1 Tax=Tetrahymena thermophila (strain SB210) TaxID=312017 RepID=Q22CF5_TETTS|nr:hypothetical protein TTHERM_01044640 [Tetrahymena thermophila SB210]EAR82974.2 hypothetical protein TTHERM_01044640 [Tetrahymena thermophila SB210]|eukprot:XP_001030637.2 hypothetical protein TTHERM_01044640 [Tetrahymena thermophila SB210]
MQFDYSSDDENEIQSSGSKDCQDTQTLQENEGNQNNNIAINADSDKKSLDANGNNDSTYLIQKIDNEVKIIQDQQQEEQKQQEFKQYQEKFEELTKQILDKQLTIEQLQQEQKQQDFKQQQEKSELTKQIQYQELNIEQMKSEIDEFKIQEQLLKQQKNKAQNELDVTRNQLQEQTSLRFDAENKLNQLYNEYLKLKNEMDQNKISEQNKIKEKEESKIKLLQWQENQKYYDGIQKNQQIRTVQSQNFIQAIQRQQKFQQQYQNNNLMTINIIQQVHAQLPAQQSALEKKKKKLQKTFYTQENSASNKSEPRISQRFNSIQSVENNFQVIYSKSSDKGYNAFKSQLRQSYGQQKQFYFTPLTIKEIICGEDGEYRGNQVKQNKVLNLLNQENITHAGQVRGDGNCFFRSIIILYLKIKISQIQNDRNKLNNFFSLLRSVKIEQPTNFKEYFQTYEAEQLVNYAKKGLEESLNKILQSQNPLQQFIEELNQEIFDFALQLLTKSLLLQVFQESEAVKMYQDEKSLKEEILDLNKEAGSDVLNILIESLLNCQLYLLKCDKNNNIAWEKIEYCQEFYNEKFQQFFLSEKQPKDLNNGQTDKVYLWYKTGHYYYLLTDKQMTLIQQSLQIQSNNSYSEFNQQVFQQNNYSYDQVQSSGNDQLFLNEQLQKNNSLRHNESNSQNYNNSFQQIPQTINLCQQESNQNQYEIVQQQNQQFQRQGTQQEFNKNNSNNQYHFDQNIQNNGVNNYNQQNAIYYNQVNNNSNQQVINQNQANYAENYQQMNQFENQQQQQQQQQQQPQNYMNYNGQNQNNFNQNGLQQIQNQNSYGQPIPQQNQMTNNFVNGNQQVQPHQNQYNYQQNQQNNYNQNNYQNYQVDQNYQNYNNNQQLQQQNQQMVYQNNEQQKQFVFQNYSQNIKQQQQQN